MLKHSLQPCVGRLGISGWSDGLGYCPTPQLIDGIDCGVVIAVGGGSQSPYVTESLRLSLEGYLASEEDISALRHLVEASFEA